MTTNARPLAALVLVQPGSILVGKNPSMLESIAEWMRSFRGRSWEPLGSSKRRATEFLLDLPRIARGGSPP